MGWRASQWAVAQETGGPAGKAILLVLAEASKDATCFLKQETIAQRAEVDRRTVGRQLKQLELRGLISRTARFKAGGRSSDEIALSVEGQPDTVSHSQDDTMSHSHGDIPPPPSVSQCDTVPGHIGTSNADRPGTESQEPVSNQESEPVLSVEPAVKPARRKPSTALPILCPSERDILWAREKARETGATLDMQSEAERFRDHHTSKDTRSADWSASWRTWIGNATRWAAERSARSGRSHQRSPLDWAKEGL